MDEQCKIYGCNGENVCREERYYCATCESEIDVVQKDNMTNIDASAEITADTVCPLCNKIMLNNAFQNGKYHCSLCGTEFDFDQNIIQPNSALSKADHAVTRLAELEKQRNNKMVWGFVWLVLCWPVSIYFFTKHIRFRKKFQMTQTCDSQDYFGRKNILR